MAGFEAFKHFIKVTSVSAGGASFMLEEKGRVNGLTGLGFGPKLNTLQVEGGVASLICHMGAVGNKREVVLEGQELRALLQNVAGATGNAITFKESAIDGVEVGIEYPIVLPEKSPPTLPIKNMCDEKVRDR